MRKSFRVYLLRYARAGFVVLPAAVMIAVPSGASAKNHKYLAHHHLVTPNVQDAQAAASPYGQTGGAMRYYGGPKSPMWRDAR
jgi:hypothetical protein